jgi:hypothetical protein
MAKAAELNLLISVLEKVPGHRADNDDEYTEGSSVQMARD